MVLPVVLGVYLLFRTDSIERSGSPDPIATIFPGKPKAILTTAEGEILPLERTSGYQRIEVGKNMYARNDGKAIVYTDSLKENTTVKYNRLAIPRGGEFHIVLSDGTEVYLNAASELKYPVSFDKEKRIVYLSGEAWFKVKKEVSRPLYVQTDAAIIRVYGTSFNVNTHYTDCIQTVLVEGKIGIRGKDEEYILRPSQLAEFGKDGSLKEIREVDVRPYIAWKDGLFLFEDRSLEDIMQTLSLWYDVDVFYANEEVKNYHFTGYMQRYDQIDKILDAIRKMVNVHFSISGKTIIISR